MKVVQLIDSLKRGGGAESLVYTFAKAAKSSGINCSIVSIRKNDPQLCQELDDDGVLIKDFSSRKLIDPIRFLRLARYIKSANPDVLHTHLSGSTIIGIAAARLIDKPVVVTLHNVKHANADHLYHGKLESWLLRNWSKHIIAVGDRTFEAHKKNIGSTPISVIPNAVRKPDVLRGSNRANLLQKIFPDFTGPVIASVGSLTEQKGYANFLHALTKVDSQFRCMIIGEGPLRNELLELSRVLGLESKVRFLGLRSDINDLLSISDIYVSSSLWEGLPVASLEAMYAGLPVVSTAVGDAEIILREDCGLLVSPGDNSALAAAISKLLNNKELRSVLAKKSFARADSDYNSDAWMTKLKAVYSSVCDS